MDEMAAKATAVVRGRVTGSYASMQGTTVFTHYRVDVLERWKGAGQGQVDVALPGGATAGFRQSFSGIPQLIEGKEYVLFLWTGKSALTQLIGLSQGLFDVSKDASGELTAARCAISGTMLDANGRAVQDRPLQMRLADMKAAVMKAMTK